jgi:hypothetical protein
VTSRGRGGRYVEISKARSSLHCSYFLLYPIQRYGNRLLLSQILSLSLRRFKLCLLSPSPGTGSFVSGQPLIHKSSFAAKKKKSSQLSLVLHLTTSSHSCIRVRGPIELHITITTSNHLSRFPMWFEKCRRAYGVLPERDAQLLCGRGMRRLGSPLSISDKDFFSGTVGSTDRTTLPGRISDCWDLTTELRSALARPLCPASVESRYQLQRPRVLFR